MVLKMVRLNILVYSTKNNKIKLIFITVFLTPKNHFFNEKQKFHCSYVFGKVYSVGKKTIPSVDFFFD